jgi:P27 family predicted phage terminase small subunit
LVGDALDEWNRVSVELYRLGCLTGLDRAALAAYCQAYGRWVAAERALEEIARQNPLASLMIKTSNGNAIQNPLVGIANRAAADMVRYATEFGMSPAARSKIEAGPIPAASKFEGLIGG